MKWLRHLGGFVFKWLLLLNLSENVGEHVGPPAEQQGSVQGKLSLRVLPTCLPERNLLCLKTISGQLSERFSHVPGGQAGFNYRGK